MIGLSSAPFISSPANLLGVTSVTSLIQKTQHSFLLLRVNHFPFSQGDSETQNSPTVCGQLCGSVEPPHSSKTWQNTLGKTADKSNKKSQHLSNHKKNAWGLWFRKPQFDLLRNWVELKCVISSNLVCQSSAGGGTHLFSKHWVGACCCLWKPHQQSYWGHEMQLHKESIQLSHD